MPTATKQFMIGPRLVLAGEEIPPGADIAALRAEGLVEAEAAVPQLQPRLRLSCRWSPKPRHLRSADASALWPRLRRLSLQR